MEKGTREGKGREGKGIEGEGLWFWFSLAPLRLFLRCVHFFPAFYLGPRSTDH